MKEIRHTTLEVLQAVLAEIIKAAELDKPGAGITFVVPVEKVAGIVHALTETCQTE